jgi:hypothetical protein
MRLFSIPVAALVLVACGGTEKTPVSQKPNPINSDNSGYTPPADYPAGPYGYNVGSTIADLGFVGRADTSLKGSASIETYPVGNIHLSDFRDNFKVLIINAGAGWCPNCMNEQPDLVSYYESENATTPTVGVLEVIVQDANDNPATMATADGWAKTYGVTFDIGVDPTGVLSPYYNIDAFPMNMVVRLSDMSIVWQFNGNDPSGLHSAVQYALNGN